MRGRFQCSGDFEFRTKAVLVPRHKVTKFVSCSQGSNSDEVGQLAFWILGGSLLRVQRDRGFMRCTDFPTMSFSMSVFQHVSMVRNSDRQRLSAHPLDTFSYRADT